MKDKGRAMCYSAKNCVKSKILVKNACTNEFKFDFLCDVESIMQFPKIIRIYTHALISDSKKIKTGLV